MHLPGDRMITCLMAELTRAGVEEIVIDKGFNVAHVVPKTSFWDKIGATRGADQRTRAERVTAAVQALLRAPEKEDVYGNRTFSEALAFRLGPRVQDGERVLLIPKKFEIRKVDYALDS